VRARTFAARHKQKQKEELDTKYCLASVRVRRSKKGGKK